MKPGDVRLFAVLGGLLVVALAPLLAFVAVPAPHNGGDNAAYLALAHALVEGHGYTELWDPEVLPHTKYPPGFPLLLAAMIHLGATSWTAFKLMSAVLTSTAILLAFAWASRRRGPVAGFAVALLTLLSSGWLDASRWVLSEPAFLAWTFLALWGWEQGIGTASNGEPGRRPHLGWSVLAGAAAIAAFMTRSAGLPLVLALFGSLFLARRLKLAAVFAAAVAVPAAWWGLRARMGGTGAYQSEFWMVNPYEPELGMVGVVDLPVRAWNNLRYYAGYEVPSEWWGWIDGRWVAVFGIVLMGVAAWGWARRLRRQPGAAELFFPLYLGLILIWPEVWSGSRFILPLYPLILLYAGEAVHEGARPLGRMGRWGLTATGVLIVALPAIPGWLVMAEGAAGCRQVASEGDVFSCHGAGFREFRDAAAWAGANLPPDAVVLNRKPRIHYVLGGQRGRVFAFTRNPDQFFEEADRIQAGYLLLDHVDGVARNYLPAVIQARPQAFCFLRGWGGGGNDPPTTLLFGLLPPDERQGGGTLESIHPCPTGDRLTSPQDPVAEGEHVPILVGAGVGRRLPIQSGGSP